MILFGSHADDREALRVQASSVPFPNDEEDKIRANCSEFLIENDAGKPADSILMTMDVSVIQKDQGQEKK